MTQLPVRYNALAALRYARTHQDPPGANEWDTPSAGRPVVLVHGFGGSAASNWFALSPLLVNAGRSVFALDYGRDGGGVLVGPSVGGVGDAYRCAEELAEYVDKVLAATGATEVDLVAHSFGGLVVQYYLKRHGGHDKVDRVVGIAPTFHGTTFNGLLRLSFVRRLGVWALGENVAQQAAGSLFVRELYSDGDTAPGVRYTVVSARWDTFTTPIRSQRLSGPQVTNLRHNGIAEHVTLAYSRRALAQVLAALQAP